MFFKYYNYYIYLNPETGVTLWKQILRVSQTIFVQIQS
jgi:hypothetical protein